MIAVAVGNLTAYGILHMRGVGGLAGWQWLFIIEGLYTIMMGIALLLLFPRDPTHPVSFSGIRYFNHRESAILAARVLRDDPSKIKKRQRITGAEFRSALGNWRAWPHLMLTLVAIAPASTINTYSPTVVGSFGYGRLRSNALVSVGSWIQVVLNAVWGITADKTKNRGLVTLAGLLLWWGFSMGNMILAYSTNYHAKYALLTMALATENIWHPINGSWLALNCRSPGERSVTMAMFIMAANMAGIIGAQLFQASDKPHYRKGWEAIFSLISVGVACCVVANVQYRLLNRRAPARVVESDQEDAATAAHAKEQLRYQL